MIELLFAAAVATAIPQDAPQSPPVVIKIRTSGDTSQPPRPIGDQIHEGVQARAKKATEDAKRLVDEAEARERGVYKRKTEDKKGGD